ncbi:MAG TPA: putative toxin-antitoxin system toxin component, PIN family [Planctomycetaceae bacterium]|nr:putative toxin-antitoxin system toxin component, PIN family [Planctomycetaceae bacterium]
MVPLSSKTVRIVVDTNVLIGSAYNQHSASRTIVTACQQGQLTLFVSPATCREYDLILPRAVRSQQQRDQLTTLIRQAQQVQPLETPRVVPDDPEDDKFLAVALAAQAVSLITNDQGVLDVGSYQGITILRPSAFLDWWRQFQAN